MLFNRMTGTLMMRTKFKAPQRRRCTVRSEDVEPRRRNARMGDRHVSLVRFTERARLRSIASSRRRSNDLLRTHRLHLRMLETCSAREIVEGLARRVDLIVVAPRR